METEPYREDGAWIQLVLAAVGAVGLIAAAIIVFVSGPCPLSNCQDPAS